MTGEQARAFLLGECERANRGTVLVSSATLQSALTDKEAASRLSAPEGETGQRCNGCGHQWNGPAPVVLCGDCWRKTWPFIWGGVNIEAAPPPPAEAREERYPVPEIRATFRLMDDLEELAVPDITVASGWRLAVEAIRRHILALRAQVQTLTAQNEQLWDRLRAYENHEAVRAVTPTQETSHDQ